MEHRDERVFIETDRYRLTGSLRLPRDGYRSRITDFLNSGERDFVALTDVTIEPLDRPGESTHREFVALGRRHIVIAAPHDDA